MSKETSTSPADWLLVSLNQRQIVLKQYLLSGLDKLKYKTNFDLREIFKNIASDLPLCVGVCVGVVCVGGWVVGEGS